MVLCGESIDFLVVRVIVNDRYCFPFSAYVTFQLCFVVCCVIVVARRFVVHLKFNWVNYFVVFDFLVRQMSECSQFVDVETADGVFYIDDNAS